MVICRGYNHDPIMMEIFMNNKILFYIIIPNDINSQFSIFFFLLRKQLEKFFFFRFFPHGTIKHQFDLNESLPCPARICCHWMFAWSWI